MSAAALTPDHPLARKLGVTAVLTRTLAAFRYAVGDNAEILEFAPARLLQRSAGGELSPADPQWREAISAEVDHFVGLGRLLAKEPFSHRIAVRAVERMGDSAIWVTEPVGETLASWLGAGVQRPTAATVPAIAASLGEALRVLHDHGLRHLDLNPDAVAISGGQVRLAPPSIDLRPLMRLERGWRGLARPGYSAIEGFDGAVRAPLDEATDVWAVSAILWRLIVGSPPTAANDPALPGAASARLADRTESADLPIGLVDAIDRGLARSPAERIRTAAEWLRVAGLGDAAEAWFEAIVVPAPPLVSPDPSPPPISPTPEPVAELPPAPNLKFEPQSESEPLPGPLDEDAPDAFHGTSPLGGEASSRNGGRVLTALGLMAVVGVAGYYGYTVMNEKTKPSTMAAAPLPSPPEAPLNCGWRAPPTLPDRAFKVSDWVLWCRDDAGQWSRVPPLERFDYATVRLARAGKSAAMERLGAFYARRGGDTQLGLALAWYLKAAEAGEAEALRALGLPSPPDQLFVPVVAQAWFERARAAGDASKMFALATLLEKNWNADAEALNTALDWYRTTARLEPAMDSAIGPPNSTDHPATMAVARIEADPALVDILAPPPETVPVEPTLKVVATPPPAPLVSSPPTPRPRSPSGPPPTPSDANAGRPAGRLASVKFVRSPSTSDLAREFPRPALAADVSGSAVIDCQIGVNFRFTDCQVESETPGGYGFGTAAVKVAAYYVLDPKPSTVGGRFRFVVRFNTGN